MADVYATISEADEAVQRQIADVLELRAAEPQQRAMLEAYLSQLPLPDGARVLEIGCGTGAVARVVAAMPGVAEVVGIDPSTVLLARARELSADRDHLSFRRGDGRQLHNLGRPFDAVICHTSLCHIPSPDRVVAEAARVTVDGGWLAVFDGDYATTTVAISENDPLQVCVDAAIAALVHDRFLVRRLPSLVSQNGWEIVRITSHGFLETHEPHYMLTLVDRGADALASQGHLGRAAADSLKQEARHRVAGGQFFGHIAYASLIARRS